MGCGCGGSKAAGAAVPRGAETRGPLAPGYAWTGPKKREDVAAKKAKQKTVA